jgi:hypothetical protein
MPETPRAEGGYLAAALDALAALVPDTAQSPEAVYLRTHRPADPTPPLAGLSERLALQPVESLSVALAAAVELDLMCGRAVSHLQAPVGAARPTLGLLATAFAASEPGGRVIERLLTGPAVESGLLQLLNEGSPLAERAVAVPMPLCLALAGRDSAWPNASIGTGNTPDTPLPPSILAEAARQARWLSTGAQNVLAMRAGSTLEGRAAAREIASSLGLRALFLEMEPAARSGASSPTAGISIAGLAGLGPFLLLRGLLPVFCFEPGPGERRSVPALPHYNGAAIALCGHEGSIEANGESPAAWSIPVPPRSERRKLWQLAIGGKDLPAQLAADYRHGSGRIAQLGRLVRQRCLLDGRSKPLFTDIAAASWTGAASGLEALAQPLPDQIPDEALIASGALRDDLSRLLLRCRRRESLIEGLGASSVARYRPGVRALLTGPSGTGKTLAASWLATQLGLPLYRADMAAVTSKYIGETEKNLAQLLARAEESGIILLFDEADSLFGKRTEVKESNDRFANAQTNYLLQRIETFDGIALLTSNSRARFDPAFCRRLDMLVEFPLPGAEERRLLWLSHLGPAHALTPKSLNLIAAVADLAGGHIRNAVLTASALAQAGNRAIEYRDIYTGLIDEYRKLGRQAPPDLGAGGVDGA